MSGVLDLPLPEGVWFSSPRTPIAPAGRERGRFIETGQGMSPSEKRADRAGRVDAWMGSRRAQRVAMRTYRALSGVARGVWTDVRSVARARPGECGARG